MKTINKSTRIIIASFSILMSSSLQANSHKLYSFVGLELSKPTIKLTEQNVTFNQNITPKFSFGLGKIFQLDENWQLISEISLDYSSSSIKRNTTTNNLSSGRFNELGLWTSAKLKRNNIFQHVAPFVELSVGTVNANYKFNGDTSKDRLTGYKAMAGLEFNIADKSTLSVAVGYSNFDDLPIMNPSL